MAVKPIPDGYHTITPYLVVPGVAKLIDFLKQAFGATEVFRMPRPDGGVMHAELRVGDSVVMMGEPRGGAPQMPVTMYLYVTDVDAVYQRALDAGAASIAAPHDEFYGDRVASVGDASGNRWYIATHVEDVAPDEFERRARAAMKKGLHA